MKQGLVVVRPEPGNGATAARARARGHDLIQLPFFAITPIVWRVPDPARHDVLLITSANAVRHGGGRLDALRCLPVVAVGAASARAAREAGFAVAAVGDGDATAAADLAAVHGFARPLHLAGVDRIAIPGAEEVATYASEALPIPADALAMCANRIVLLHSARAARRLADLVPDLQGARLTIGIAGLSAAVIAAAGRGWREIMTAPVPTDPALLDAIDRARLTGPCAARISGQ